MCHIELARIIAVQRILWAKCCVYVPACCYYILLHCICTHFLEAILQFVLLANRDRIQWIMNEAVQNVQTHNLFIFLHLEPRNWWFFVVVVCPFVAVSFVLKATWDVRVKWRLGKLHFVRNNNLFWCLLSCRDWPYRCSVFFIAEK